jgi:hypothetical protein
MRQKLTKRWDQVNLPCGVKKLGGGSANVHEVQTSVGQFVIRTPRAPYSVSGGQRVHQAFHILATQMGEPDMVPVSVKSTASFQIGNIAVGREIQVVEHIGDNFVPYGQASENLIHAVPERIRLVGGLLDLLGEYLDRHGENMAVEVYGCSVRLMDHDNSFGWARERGWLWQSPFWLGGKLACSGQSCFCDLPDDLQIVVSSIADSSNNELYNIYGLEESEACRLKAQAQRIQAVGVSAATQIFMATLTTRQGLP